MGRLRLLHPFRSVGILCFFLLAPRLLSAQSLPERDIPGAIHIDALEYNENELSIAQAADLADRAGLGVAIITPHDQEQVAYGLPLLRYLLRTEVSRSSVRTYGVSKYIGEVHATDAQYPRVLVIDGVEAIPAYYWESSPLTGSAIVRNFHKHLLVIGLTSAEDYSGLPSVTNGFPPTSWLSWLFEFWPGALIIIGLVLAIQAHRNDAMDNPRSARPGLLTALAGGVLLINNLPGVSLYDQYHGDPGDGPYQSVIDYANTHGALTFWAHPEVSQRLARAIPWPASVLADSVVFNTEPYTQALLGTRDYTGFAIFETGISVVGKPGGIWDQTLTEYCAGVRKRPVWAIGELDLENGSNVQDMTTCETVFFLNDFTREGALDALRKGAIYARRGTGNLLRLKQFAVSNEAGTRTGVMGQKVTLASSPTIHFTLASEDGKPRNLSVLVIRDGTVIRTVQTSGDLSMAIQDKVIAGSGTTFYRLMVLEDDWPVLASNPVFVTIRKNADQLPALAEEPGA